MDRKETKRRQNVTHIVLLFLTVVFIEPTFNVVYVIKMSFPYIV